MTESDSERRRKAETDIGTVTERERERERRPVAYVAWMSEIKCRRMQDRTPEQLDLFARNSRCAKNAPPPTLVVSLLIALRDLLNIWPSFDLSLHCIFGFKTATDMAGMHDTSTAEVRQYLKS